MLRGTASTDDVFASAPTMTDLGPSAVELDDATVVKAMYELPYAARTAVLPAGLQPANPPIVVLHLWRVGASPWGPFRMAEVRVGCRAGTRPRALVVGCVVDEPGPAEALAAGWGFPTRVGRVDLTLGYDRVGGRAEVDDTIVSFTGTDPDPLGAADVQWTTTVCPAHTPRGPRLVQVDVEPRIGRSERLRELDATLETGTALADGLALVTFVSASVSSGTYTLQPLRFLQQPDELAFTGTERV